MHKPIISYVIPCYNCETTIFDTVLSIKISEPKLWDKTEVILVDDGSTDFTYNICSILEKNYDNIIFISSENEGKGKARNKGNKSANADIIAVLDADDWNCFARTKITLETFKKNPEADVFYSSFVTKDNNSSDYAMIDARKIDLKKLWELGTFGICHSSVAYRKKAILEFPYSDDRNKDDWDMLFNFLKNNKKFCFSKEVLVMYRFDLTRTFPNGETREARRDRILTKKKKKMKEYYRTLNEPIGETK